MNMLIDKIRGAILLHRELGIGYFQLLRGYLKKDKIITVNIKNLAVNMEIHKALMYASGLRNIRKDGWEIVDIINNLIVYENRQKGIKLYSRIEDCHHFVSEIREVFVEELYKSDFTNKVVVDVGTYVGESAIYFAINGAKKVIALEPDEENYQLALKNVKENGLEDRVVLLNKAVADKEGVINLYRYSYPSDLGSTDPNNMPPPIDKLVVKKVEAITLDGVIKIAGERIGLLKLDCEGCEYSVLNSFYKFDIIDNIILEYHNGLQNLPSLLKSHGFEIIIKKKNEKIGIIRAFKNN